MESNDIAFDALAPFYERHWGESFFWTSTELFRDLLASRLEPGSRMLDLCCGTGGFAGWLHRQGMEVMGIDNSARMLRSARASLPRVEFHRADMREFDLQESFDAVTCMYNSINQALTTRSVRSVLGRVRRHLRQGGWFLFDFVCEEGFLESWDADEIVRLEDELCHLRYRYDRTRSMAICKVSIAAAHGGGLTVDFELRQRPLEVAELRAELNRAGFAISAISPVRNSTPERGRYAVLARAGSGSSDVLSVPMEWADCSFWGAEMVGAPDAPVA
jgi:SAM-dependent methyltransferase